MQEFNYAARNLKPGKIPLIVSVICLALNFVIGETIFGNVILILISFFSAVSAFLSALIAFFRSKRGSRPTGILIVSGIVIAVICALVMTDNIAVGYGP